jgi:DNA-directed RNA polymerase subunit RPC12/RpoP
VSLLPCSRCKARFTGKAVSVSWAWWLADQSRVAYRQRLCPGCWKEMLSDIEAKVHDEPFLCPICGGSADETMDPTYCTSFIPEFGPLRLEMATCAGCAVPLRVQAQVGATRLPDRQVGFGGPGPQTNQTGAGVWASLGLVPRE